MGIEKSETDPTQLLSTDGATEVQPGKGSTSGHTGR